MHRRATGRVERITVLPRSSSVRLGRQTKVAGRPEGKRDKWMKSDPAMLMPAYSTNELQARLRAVKRRLAEIAAAPPPVQVETAKERVWKPQGRPACKSNDTQAMIEFHRSLQGPELQQAFEAQAWHHHAANGQHAVRAVQDEAEEWLRGYERRVRAERQAAEVPESAEPVAWSQGAGRAVDNTDWRGEIRAAAAAGDAYAKWRAWELFDAPDCDENAADKQAS